MANEPKLIVGVGASAGGLQAFKALLKVLPADADMAFLLVQHLDPTHESLLSELLSSHSDMDVIDAEQGLQVRANSIYIIQPDTALGVKQGKLAITSPTIQRGVRLPIDHLFRSLAYEYGARAVGIVLSGAGSDGTSGLREIKARSGLTIAQDPDEAGQTGMPQSAIDSGLIDLELPIADIPKALKRYSELRPGELEEEEERSSDKPKKGSAWSSKLISDDQLRRLGALLDAQQGFDLKVYKTGTIRRRIMRRAAISGFEDVEGYLGWIRENPSEQQLLLRDFLISVTDFFRDTEAFETLREDVIEPYLRSADSGTPIRIWCAGCATGEEAYSLGIELLEAIEASGKDFPLQIFATDVDAEALRVARQGVYPVSIIEQIPKRRLDRYFSVLEGRGYRVKTKLRDLVSFAVHDLTKDPPFSKMNLVSCRNVLIYLTQTAQSHVLHNFHFALCPKGCLMLSTSETTGKQKSLFSTISKKQRLFQKVGASLAISMRHSSRSSRSAERSPKHEASEIRNPRPEPNTAELARRAALEAFLPPTVVVSGTDEVVYSHGELAPFLQFPQDGSPRFDLSSVLRPSLSMRARAALYKSRQTQTRVEVTTSPTADSNERIRISAAPAQNLSDESVVMSFRILLPGVEDESSKSAPISETDSSLINEIERELQATREDLRTTVEELETSNEELRSSNEESMSMNEELQSANEELEATTEELRSLNEELTTINNQLRDKVEQLEVAHDDLANFFASTDIATLFLDDSLRVKRFTPAARELLRIDHSDAGRFVGTVARELLQNGLEADAAEVLETFGSVATTIETNDGRWVERHTRPYKTDKRRIEGVVVTFLDITAVTRATNDLQVRNRQQSVVAELGLVALKSPKLGPFLGRVVREVQSALSADFCKILEVQPGTGAMLLRVGVGWDEGIVGEATVPPGVESQAGFTLESEKPIVVSNLNSEKRFSGPPLLEDHGVTSGISCSIGDSDQPYGVIGVHTREQRNFSIDDAYFIQSVAAVVGWAVQRHHRRLENDMELAASQVLEAEVPMEDALRSLMEQLAECAGEPAAAELWLFEESLLKRKVLHARPTTLLRKVESSLPGAPVSRGDEGIVAVVAEEQEAVWLSRHGDRDNLDTIQLMQKLGLDTGLVLPVCAGPEFKGVLSIYSSEHFFCAKQSLVNFAQIGRALGTSLARWEADDAAKRLASLTQSSLDAIVGFDQDGTITDWHPGSQRMLGYTEDEILGQPFETLFPKSEHAKIAERHRRAFEGEETSSVTALQLHKSGKEIPVSIHTCPIMGRNGDIVGVASTSRNISELVETEQRLRDADRQKNEFIAMLGHELRNPLAAIGSAAELLGDGPDSMLKRAQPIIKRQVVHMSKLINDLLDVSRVVRGIVELSETTVDLSKVCTEVAANHAELAKQRSIQVHETYPKKSAWISGDPVRLTQIVDNLIGNALKYNVDGGEVFVRIEPVEDWIELTVEDTGTGIEEELLPHIFEEFRQSRQDIDRSKGGLGLGLAITRSLVVLHNGTIRANSEGSGEGSKFVVRIPATSAPETQAVSTQASIENLTILVVEDNRDAGEMLQLALEGRGHEVSLAYDGAMGLEMLEGARPDVVICDLGLPNNMSGYDFAERVRSEESGSHLPLVALSGYGGREDRKRSSEVGFDAHLTKPVDVSALLAVLAAVAQTR